jgi:DNA repair protein RecN (Recombination protein N)
MLETLHIQNYALIDDVELDFRPGFNVLTGETGAGKSIVVGALNLVLGARASGETVRSGARRAKIDAVFRLKQPSKRLTGLLAEAAIELEDDELILSRHVTAEGRSRAYVSGNLTPISLLARIGDELVDIHGQHDHQSLLKRDRQLDLLDAFAGAEPAAASVKELVAELHQVEKAIKELETGDRERARRVEFLKFEASEINAAGLVPGEEEDLRARRNLITNAEKVVQLASRAYETLYENEGVSTVDTADAALRDIEELAEVDGRFQPLVERLTALRSGLDDIAAEVRGFTEEIEYDPGELDALNQRLALIGGLKRKYGDSVDAILAYRDQADAEINRLDQSDKHIAAMHARRGALNEDGAKKAKALSRRRKTAARKLDKQVTETLQKLGMKGGRFETRIEACDLSLNGVDRVEFLLSANPGENVKPLRQVASGGETSRVMLAIKAVFASADTVPTLIFDEIDAGVGGNVANRVAEKLRDLAASHQTICVTHLAQIAAAAHVHYHVAKAPRKGGRTQTTVVHVAADSRVAELARLLDGSQSDVSLEHARTLLAGRD